MKPLPIPLLKNTPPIYLVFNDAINQNAIQRIVINIMGPANNEGVVDFHLFFHSYGGIVNDGIALHNLFKALPVNLTVYNPGTVQSIAVIAYLGAKKRVVSSNATFVIHRTTFGPIQAAPAATLNRIAESAALDDKRTDEILRRVTTIPEDRLALMDIYDVVFPAAEAVDFGIAHEVGDFAPPPGAKVYTV